MFIPDSGVFLRQLRQAGSTLPVISTDGNADPALLDAGAEGDRWFHLHELGVHRGGRPKVQAFYDDYNTQYGKDPSSYVAVIGYDEVNLSLKSMIEAAGSTTPARHGYASLSNLDYNGISGHAVMDPSTRRANKPAVVDPDGRHQVHLSPRRLPSSFRLLSSRLQRRR